VAVTPETVKRFLGVGARVRIERGAGGGSFFPDEAYAAAGAEIVSDAAAIYGESDVVLKVKEPRLDPASGRHEVDLMRPGLMLIAFLHPAAPHNRRLVERLASRGVVALTLDGVPRLARTQAMDALSSMSLVAGYKGTLMGADALPKFMPLTGTSGGAFPPARMLVIGTGVCGLQAIATGKRLGAAVQASDIRAEAREQAGSLGAIVLDPGVPADMATGRGGYARALPPAWLERERDVLRQPVANADLVILSALVPGRRAPVLVTDEMVAAMRPGSAIVDIAIDQGGNCAASEVGQIARRHGVTIQALENLPGRMPVAATALFAQNAFHFLAHLVTDGRVELKADDDVVASTLVTRDGRVVHAGTLECWAAQREGSA
jgi:NAD(P) transhydrogenase subunit alpha